MRTGCPHLQRNPHHRNPKCLIMRRNDVQNSKEDASAVGQVITWSNNENYLQKLHAILANNRAMFLQFVNVRPLSGRQLQILLQIPISCNFSTRPVCLPIRQHPPSMFLSKAIRTSTSLHQSFRCDWQLLTSRDRECWSAVCQTLAALNPSSLRIWPIRLSIL